VVMPGRYETFGLVALEAAACGAAVVACETAPVTALLDADTFVPGDTRSLCDAIDRARARSPDASRAAALSERHT